MPIVARILISDILQPFLDNVWAKQKVYRLSVGFEEVGSG